MNLFSRKREAIALFLTLVAGGLSIYFFFLHREGQLVSFYNSDQLEIPYLFKNLVYDHGSFRYWTFSAVNYFFPDGLIFFIMASILKNLKIALLISNIVIFSIPYFFIVRIGRLTCGQENTNLFRISALLFLIMAPYTGFLSPLLISHFGSTFVMCLVNVYFILKLFEKPKFIYYFLLSAFCFLTTFSDPLFLVTFIAPAAVSLLLLLRMRMCLILGLSGLLGYFTNAYDLLDFHIVHEPVNIHITQGWALFRELGPITLYHKGLLDYIGSITLYRNDHNPIYLLIDVFYLILVLAILFNLYRDIKIRKIEYQGLLGLKISNLFVLITILFCCIFSVFAVVYVDKDLFSHGYILLHLVPAILLPVFLGLPILLAQYSNIGKALNICYEIIPVSIILIFFIVTQQFSLNYFVKYYPPITQCLDNYSQKDYLVTKNGITGYWDAHINNVLSKENLHLVSVTPSLTPYNWMSTSLDYLNKKFNFVVIGTEEGEPYLSPVKIIKKLGKPNLVLTCPNSKEYTIYVYKNGFSMSSAGIAVKEKI